MNTDVTGDNVRLFPAAKRPAGRQRRKATATVVQIPTKANKKQRCQAAAKRDRADCEAAIFDAHMRIIENPITGIIAITATDLAGGDFNLRHAGIYADDPEAALSTLVCLVKYYEEIALEARNARAMARAQPAKRPAFKVLL